MNLATQMMMWAIPPKGSYRMECPRPVAEAPVRAAAAHQAEDRDAALPDRAAVQHAGPGPVGRQKKADLPEKAEHQARPPHLISPAREVRPSRDVRASPGLALGLRARLR